MKKLCMLVQFVGISFNGCAARFGCVWRLRFNEPRNRNRFVYILVFYLLCLTGCRCNGPALSSARQIREFEKAGSRCWILDTRYSSRINPPTAGLDRNPALLGRESRIENQESRRARVTYTYRVVPGDVLELQMPAVLWEISSDSFDWLQRAEPYLCRLSDDGTITLPTVGKVPVAGKTLAEVESSVVDAYFPKYVVELPAVVCRVAEHRNQRVFAVLGLVKKPDAFGYPADVQYNLMDVLALAGGVDLAADPHYVKIYRQRSNGKVVSATFGIDSKSFADASNVIVKPGDVVSVEITPRTRTNLWLSQMLRLNFGAYVRPEDF